MKQGIMFHCCVVVLFVFLIGESVPTKILKISVPEYKIRGQSALLECEYDLQGGELYAVKWYKDGEEFYRYMPRFHPPQHWHKLDGVRVDVSRSDDSRVTLQQVTLKASGLYRCEVSAEAPNFASAQGEGRMEIVYLPKDGPKITYNNESRNEQYLALNCTSGRSYPAAILSWDINGEKVTDPKMLVQYPSVEHTYGLLSSVLELRVPRGQTMKVKCTARVAPSWREGREALVSNLHLTDSREALLLVRSSAKKVSSSLLSWFGLIIIASWHL